jgi:serine/threonine protein kinase
MNPAIASKLPKKKLYELDEMNGSPQTQHELLEQRNYSLVGTEEYVPPEILLRKDVTYSTDLWSLGIMLFQFFYGKTPFKGQSEYITFENIIKHDLVFPDVPLVPNEVKDLIKKLLEKDPHKRIGFSSI